MGFNLTPVLADLPQGFTTLQSEAVRGGYRFLDRLHREWFGGQNRFDRKGECLLAAFVSGELGAVGGMTIEPNAVNALRMRRFYVHSRWRRLGLGRAFARDLLDRASHDADVVTVNAGSPGAAVFWEALGFAAQVRDGYTHIWKFR